MELVPHSKLDDRLSRCRNGSRCAQVDIVEVDEDIDYDSGDLQPHTLDLPDFCNCSEAW